MRSRRRVLVGGGLVAVLLAATVLASGDGRLYLAQLASRVTEQADGTPAATLTDLASMDQLKAAFNNSTGEPPLILRLSPTLPVCNAGARWVRSDVLRRHPNAKLRVLVVWFDMMLGDSRATTDLRLLSDRRAPNFWDERRIAGRWFAANVDQSEGIDWDEYFLYGPRARRDFTPGHLVSSGSSVIGSSGQLASAIAPLLR